MTEIDENQNIDETLNDIEPDPIDEEQDEVIDDSVDDSEIEQTEASDESAKAEAPDDSDVVVSFGDDPVEEQDTASAPTWVKELRKANREKERRIRELEQQIQAAAPVAKEPELGPKPTLASCEFDEQLLDSRLDAWYARKLEVDEIQAKKKRAEEAQRAEWQSRLDSYNAGKSALKVSDYEDAEAVALEALNVTQQGIILTGVEKPAMFVYALGKNPAKAKELGSINDPVKFAIAIGKLETQLKVTPRKTVPTPERTVKGSAPISGAVDTTIERLRAEAQRTGDASKLIAYKTRMRDKARA